MVSQGIWRFHLFSVFSDKIKRAGSVCVGISANITTSNYLPLSKNECIRDGCVDVEKTWSDEVMERRGVEGWRSVEEGRRGWTDQRTEGGDTGPLLHCLTSSGIQPRARATNGGLSASLSLSFSLSLSHPRSHTHTQQSHSKCTLHVQIWIHACLRARSYTSRHMWI